MRPRSSAAATPLRPRAQANAGSVLTPAASRRASAARQRVARSALPTTLTKLPHGGAHVPVARRVDRQLLVAAGDPAAQQQLAPFGAQQVDAPAHAPQVRGGSPEGKAQVAPQPALDGMGENLGYQVGDFVRVVLGIYPLRRRQLPVEMGGVQHQQPDVADRNPANGSRAIGGRSFTGGGRRRRAGGRHQKSASRVFSWASALSV